MSHEIGAPRLPQPTNEWSPVWMRDFVRVLSDWMVRMTTETSEELAYESVSTITADTSAGEADGMFLLDTTSSDVVLTLPDPAEVLGKEYVAKRISGGSYQAVVTAAAGSLEQSAALYLMDQYTSYTVKSDGTDYWIVAAVYGNSMIISPAVGTLTAAGIAPTVS